MKTAFSQYYIKVTLLRTNVTRDKQLTYMLAKQIVSFGEPPEDFTKVGAGAFIDFPGNDGRMYCIETVDDIIEQLRMIEVS